MKRLITIVIILLAVGFNDQLFAQLRLEGIKREALKHMQNGRYGDAIDQLNKFIAADPRNPEGYYLRGLCYENRQQYANGREDYRKAVKLDRGYTEARRALERLEKVWFEILYDKIEGHKRDIAVNPNNPYYYLEIGKAYRWLEEWEKAEEWYDKYLARDKNASPDEIIRYTIILTETGHIYKGWVKLKEYTERYPDDWRLWSRFGWFSNWLSKYKVAENAFLNALKFKPFFKEALDGIDVARREAYVTIYTEDYNYNKRNAKEYPVDRYYRILRNNPDDDDNRFRLVELLIEHRRYEEAYQQLQILKAKHGDEEKFQNLWSLVDTYRRKFYEDKITEALTVLADDPYNKKATVEIAQYYALLSAYEEAEELLKKYLTNFPNDDEVRYIYAKILSENSKFNEAFEEVNKLLSTDIPKLEYKLLAAQLNIWMNKDLDLAEKLLNEIIEKHPDDIIALIAMGTLNFQKNNIDKAEEFANRAAAIDPNNQDLNELQAMVELERIRQVEQNAIDKLDIGRELAADGKCEEAIPYFDEYIDRYPVNNNLKIEFANVLVCADRYSEAVDIYNEVLEDEYKLEWDKQRAKIYYWSGDSLKAYEEFGRLVTEDPDDLEMQIYFGDVNVKMGNYEIARDIYIALKERAPESYLINQRLEWLPPEYRETTALGRFFGTITNYAFSYLNVNPVASYFNDNLGFEYYFGGSDLAIGFTRYISLGATFHKGVVNNSSSFSAGLYYSLIKGNVHIYPMKNLNLSFGYGKVSTPGILDQIIYDGVIYYKPVENFNTSLRYSRTDGVFQLYSNELINRRIPSNNLRFDADYRYKTGLLLSTYYSLIWTDKNNYEAANIGNYFQFRLGKRFKSNSSFGYEYRFEDFKYNSVLYYTPQIFESHSLWGEWQVYMTELWDFKIGGKLGYVPISDFVLRELNVQVSYKIFDRLRLLANGYLSSSVQQYTAYSSGSFYINLFWSVY